MELQNKLPISLLCKTLDVNFEETYKDPSLQVNEILELLKNDRNLNFYEYTKKLLNKYLKKWEA